MVLESSIDFPSIVILVTKPSASAFACGQTLWGWEESLIQEKLRRAGILQKEVKYVSISQTTSFPNDNDYSRCLGELNSLNPSVIVALDEIPLVFTTGKHSIWKWHLSPLDTLGTFTARKVIPSFHPEQIRKSPELGLYLELALRRAREESSTREFSRKPERFLLNPRIEVVLEKLKELQTESYLSVDIETGRGQINTVGFAWSASDAIAINVLPDNYGPANYYKLWDYIRELLEGPIPKIYQNALYEVMCFSRYGIRTNNIWHDTMLAQKFLWPELDKGLDNVGRLYTKQPYWKDDGKVTTEKKEKKDWGNIRDWVAHYTYNCRDTSNTFEAAFEQRKDLLTRGKLELFDSYLMRLLSPVSEMCIRGLPLDTEKRQALIIEREQEVKEWTAQLSDPKLNPASPKQKLKLFKDKKYKIPKSRGTDGKWKESTDELSLKKMLLVHPEDKDIPLLLRIAEQQKALSSYLRVETNSLTGRIHFSLDICGTETLRMASRKDPWDQGFNSQTIPKDIKKMISWPEESGRVFFQFDLKQAESRYVAYNTADANLIAALEDKTRDIHSEVAYEIINKLGLDVSKLTKEEFKNTWRQLGKKSGHLANYDGQWGTLAEGVLKDMGQVLSRKESEAILEAYHTLFLGIRRGHKEIKQKLYNTRYLENALGVGRYFYGRMDDATFREAYAYESQSAIPMITNHLILAMTEARTRGELNFWWHNQIHDAALGSCIISELDAIAEFGLNVDKWHPAITLKGGKLIIPTDCEYGRNLGELNTWTRT